MSETFDIAIAGGGMVGASLAVAVAPLGLRVAIIERFPPATAGQPSYDDRSTAVAYGSRRIFETMGTWQAIAAGATAIRRIRVSDRGSFGSTTIDRADLGVDALGYVVENRVLGEVLWREMRRGDSVTIFSPAAVTGANCDADQVSLSIDENGSIRQLGTRLLVIADGARSVLRDQAGFHASARDYGQVAVIANVTTERAHNHVAYERFTTTGPLAFLPLDNGRCSVVWSLSRDEAAAILALDDKAFLQALQAAFGYRLGRLQRVGERASYPLQLTRADTVTGQRTVLIGNAANGLHPVAGQGFNLGLRDVAALADVIADAIVAPGRAADIGGTDTLLAYLAWRTADQADTADLTDGLVRLFAQSSQPLAMLRGLALSGLDALPIARRALARRMMGLAGRQPRLARGVPLA